MYSSADQMVVLLEKKKKKKKTKDRTGSLYSFPFLSKFACWLSLEGKPSTNLDNRKTDGSLFFFK